MREQSFMLTNDIYKNSKQINFVMFVVDGLSQILINGEVQSPVSSYNISRPPCLRPVYTVIVLYPMWPPICRPPVYALLYSYTPCGYSFTAKVYPRQQQTQPPPQQLQHGGNARVITSGVRLPVSTATDTTSAPTNSFQPMQQSVNRAPILPPTLQNLSTGPGHNNRQHGPPPHTVISTQQPFHHAHNRYNFAQELFGMLPCVWTFFPAF